jgi:tetratricopeptide (TPR) repeat protein
LYARVEAWGALVLPSGDTIVQQRQAAKFRFLDRQERVRVAGADEFVGRRRYLQRGLRELKSPQNLGIWLHGIGGVGKSTIACRLLDRLGASYQPVVCYRDFDETVLLALLSRECESSRGHEILNGNLSQFLKQGLNAPEQGLNKPEQRYLFILDDFEANLEERGDGSWVLKPSVVEPLTALLTGIDRSQLPHRIIITSRYDVKLPEFNSRWARLQVDRLDRSDVAKKYQRLKAFQAGSTVDRELQTQAKSIADGYPRLLEWLDKVLQDDRTDSAAILAAMAGKQQEFLEDILAAQLLAQQEPDLRTILTRGLIFELPVPLVALQAICEGIEGFERHVERARSVGLLEVGLDGAVRVPRVLGLAVGENGAELAAVGVKVLMKEWVESVTTEERAVELHRLALLAGDRDIAVKIAKGLSDSWLDTSRYSEALTLCEDTLALHRDNKLIYNLVTIYTILGDWQKSLDYNHQNLAIYREIGNCQGEAASLHQRSIVCQKQGEWQKSLEYSHQSLAISREIGDCQGEAASLHQLSMVYIFFCHWQKALDYSQQSLTIQREIGDCKGEAVSLHQLSIVYQNQGEWQKALDYSQQSLTIQREIGNRQGEATSLHQLSCVYQNQGEWQKALDYSHQSLTIDREIGDLQGEAASLNQMATISYRQGETAQAEQFLLETAEILSSIDDYSSLITSFRNLGFTVADRSLIYFSQSLWLTLRLSANLQDTMILIEAMYQQLPPGDPLKLLLGNTALYFCQDSPHPDRSQLQERSLGILAHTAEQQGISSPEQFDEWIVQNRLNDPKYFLPALDARLVEIIGDNWLFDPLQVQ